MNYFISYDIADPKRLAQVAKVIENYGWRVQYSFFQCELENDRLAELEKKLLRIMDKKEDSIMVQPLSADCVKPYAILGTGSVFVSKGYQIL